MCIHFSYFDFRVRFLKNEMLKARFSTNWKMQVRLCRAKSTGEIFAMKKLKKSEMLSRGQVTRFLDALYPQLFLLLLLIF